MPSHQQPVGGSQTRVLVFDGLCPFCSRTALWVIRHDRRDRFRLAASQSDAGRRFLAGLTPTPDPEESIVLVENGVPYTRSAAVLRMFRRLDAPWPLLYGFILVPRFLRDAIYRFVAARRRRWFGARNSCFVPDEKTKSRFL